MKSAQRNMRICMPGREFDGLLQRPLDLAAQTLRQRLRYADALAVAAKRVSLPIPGIGIFGVCRLLRFGLLRHLQKQIKFGFFLAFKVIGINGSGFVGHRDAIAASL